VTFARFRYLAIEAARKCGHEASTITPMLVESLTRNASLKHGASAEQWVCSFLGAAQLWEGDVLEHAECVAGKLLSDRTFTQPESVVDRAVMGALSAAKGRLAS
jgi:Zn ribbon nucleic-acid-binding protein